MARRSENGSSPGSAFDRDFGYLLPFLDKVVAAASTLQDPAARSELQRLMAEEKQRWARARELLAGAQGRIAAQAAAPAQAPAAGPGAPRVQGGSPQLTVGSLKAKR